MKALVISHLCSGLAVIESLLRSKEITSVSYYDNGDYYKGLNPKVKFLGRFNPISFKHPDMYQVVIDTTSIKNNRKIQRFFPSAEIKVGHLFDQRWCYTEYDKYKFKQYCKNRGVLVPKDYLMGGIYEAEAFLSANPETKYAVKQVFSNTASYPVLAQGKTLLPKVDTKVFVESFHDFDHYVHVAYLLKGGKYYFMSIQHLDKFTDRYVKGFSQSYEIRVAPMQVADACKRILTPLAQDFRNSPDKLGTLQFGYENGRYYLLENQARLNCMGVLSVPDMVSFLRDPTVYKPSDTKALYSTKSYYLTPVETLDLSKFPRSSYFIASHEPQILDSGATGVFRSKAPRFLVMFRDASLKAAMDAHILSQSVIQD